MFHVESSRAIVGLNSYYFHVIWGWPSNQFRRGLYIHSKGFPSWKVGLDHPQYLGVDRPWRALFEFQLFFFYQILKEKPGRKGTLKRVGVGTAKHSTLPSPPIGALTATSWRFDELDWEHSGSVKFSNRYCHNLLFLWVMNSIPRSFFHMQVVILSLKMISDHRSLRWSKASTS